MFPASVTITEPPHRADGGWLGEWHFFLLGIVPYAPRVSGLDTMAYTYPHHAMTTVVSQTTFNLTLPDSTTKVLRSRDLDEHANDIMPA